MVANTNLPFYQTVIAGGGAGVCEIALMYPTDVSTFPRSGTVQKY